MRIGIDLGGTKIEAIVLGDDGAEIRRRRITTPRDYAATLVALKDLVSDLEAEAGAASSVGLGHPGAISPRTGLIKNANSTWLNGQPLGDDLTRVLDRPVRLANDADCFALSEATDGAAAGAGVVFGVIVGTGTGGGIVVGGALVRGVNAIAGEWGHNPLPWPRAGEWPGPPCYCGRTGCIETFLSGPGFARDYQASGGDAIAAPAIVARAEGGEALAVACLERYADRMARGLASVINLLDPHVIVLGGGMSNVTRLYDQVPQLWEAFVFSDHVATTLMPPVHGDSSGVRGAAWLLAGEPPKIGGPWPRTKDIVNAVISYSSADPQLAWNVRRQLQEQPGWNVLSDHDLATGEDWDETIRKWIANADCLVALISRSSTHLDSRCQDEWAHAFECYRMRGRPRVLPIRLDDSPIPWQFRDLHVSLLERDGLQKAVDEGERWKVFHDFWGDSFFEADLQLAVAERTLVEGRWEPNVPDPKAGNAQAEGVAHWLAVQDIRAAVHLTKSLPRLRERGIKSHRREIDVVHGQEVELDKGNHCAIALGLGFNSLTHELQHVFSKTLFDIQWHDVNRSGFEGRTDDFALPAHPDWSPPDGCDKALIARIVLPRVHTSEADREQIENGFSVYFVCAGRTAAGTAAAGWYLGNHWNDFLTLYCDHGLALQRDSVAAVLCHKADPDGTHKYDGSCRPAVDDGQHVFVVAQAPGFGPAR